MLPIRTASLYLAGLSLVLVLLTLLGVIPAGYGSYFGFAAAVLVAFGLGSVSKLKGYQYTAWIMAAVVGGLLFPDRFLHLGDFDLRNKWLILIIVQMVMFGMGTQMRLNDFKGVAQSPRGVMVGLLCQFTIMPTMGYVLTRVFDFPVEIAAGIILIGSCSSGLASNVMAYLARANLALSVTVTAVATLVAPLMTPLLMKLYASTLVEVKFLGMMMSIVKIVLAPIGAALLADFLSKAAPQVAAKIRLLALACLAWLLFVAFGGWAYLEGVLPEGALMSAGVFGFFCAAVVFGVIYQMARSALPALQTMMPYISMFGIVYFTTVTTAAGRDSLLQVGALLLVASVLHNLAGFTLGYWMSRLLGLDRNSARAMALEVGLQNGGMASGIAGAMGKLGTLGLASAVFSPWMNISGSILANIWRLNPVDEVQKKTEPVLRDAAPSGGEVSLKR